MTQHGLFGKPVVSAEVPRPGGQNTVHSELAKGERRKLELLISKLTDRLEKLEIKQQELVTKLQVSDTKLGTCLRIVARRLGAEVEQEVLTELENEVEGAEHKEVQVEQTEAEVDGG